MLITKSTFNNQQYGETTLKNGETKMKKRTLVEESENTVLEINNLKKKYFKYETQYDEANDILDCLTRSKMESVANIKDRMSNCKVMMNFIDDDIKSRQNYIKDLQVNNGNTKTDFNIVYTDKYFVYDDIIMD